MVQGVILFLKAFYKSLSVLKLIKAIYMNEKLPVLSILDTKKMLDVAWQKMQAATVVYCLAKAGISKEQQNATLEDDDDPFKKLQEQIDKLAIRAPNLFPDGPLIWFKK